MKEAHTYVDVVNLAMAQPIDSHPSIYCIV